MRFGREAAIISETRMIEDVLVFVPEQHYLLYTGFGKYQYFMN